MEQAGGRLVEGIAEGVGLDGTLLLRQSDGTHIAVSSGDAHIMPERDWQRVGRSAVTSHTLCRQAAGFPILPRSERI